MPNLNSQLKTSLHAERVATASAFFLDGLVFATWVSRIPTIQERLHLRNAMLGIALLMISLGAVVTMPLMGRLVAKRGGGSGTSLAVAYFGVSLFLPAMTNGIVGLSIALFLFGIGFGGCNVALNAQAVLVERKYSRPIMASFHAMFSLGGISGALLGSVAAARSVSPIIHFAIVGLIALVVALIIRSTVVKDASEYTSNSASGSAKGKIFVLLGAIAFCSSLGEGAMSDWTGVFLRQVSKSQVSTAAIGFAAYSAAMTLGRMLADWVTASIGPVRTVVLGGALSAGGLLVAMLFPSVSTAIGGFAIVGLGLSALIPTIFSAAGRLPGVAPSVAIATVATTGYFGFLSGPPVIGFISEWITLRWALGLVVIASCITVAMARHVAVGTSVTPSTEKPIGVSTVPI